MDRDKLKTIQKELNDDVYKNYYTNKYVIDMLLKNKTDMFNDESNPTWQNSKKTNAIFHLITNKYPDDYLLSKLNYFENKYKLDSPQFFEKYVNGSLDNKDDYKDWYYFYLLLNRLL